MFEVISYLAFADIRLRIGGIVAAEFHGPWILSLLAVFVDPDGPELNTSLVIGFASSNASMLGENGKSIV